ncbi:CRAL/TRIO domain-containing protein [Mycena indigotica]|uniref:CRAL/TRIO domain-containing protein n=1 Tax=Mycena indigotica TaxID=2126181 RepID=A0A8H6TAM6_9AGAR|nr:CRAL/TRIO domain-containing protein [Mycena indigotica]KAF7312385.1 CRAL/TRIO domain-containing protein [Mycena indigotica]
MPETVYVPTSPPNQAAQPLQPAELTEEQQKMQETVLSHFSDPDFKPTGSETGLSDEEKMWVSHECILRYLRASKWKVDVAKARLDATLAWRRQYGIYDKLKADYVEPEAVTGKQIIFGHDVNGSPGLYLLPSRQNTNEPPQQIEFTVWMLERCIDMMPAGVESLDLLVDYADKAKNPSFGTARAVLNILQDHYPERLHYALILNVPFLLNAFFKFITPFIDPVTRLKMKFNPKVVEDGIFDSKMVTERWGGDVIVDYKHEQYWPALVDITNERRALWMKNWQALGAKVGLKEADYKRVAEEKVHEEAPEPALPVDEA